MQRCILTWPSSGGAKGSMALPESVESLDWLPFLQLLLLAKSGKSCELDGKTYSDGEEFKPNCSQLCTCQDGVYACASLCPQELRPPSSVHCQHAQLVVVEGQCCREWVCPHSFSLPGPDDDNYIRPGLLVTRALINFELYVWEEFWNLMKLYIVYDGKQQLWMMMLMMTTTMMII